MARKTAELDPVIRPTGPAPAADPLPRGKPQAATINVPQSVLEYAQMEADRLGLTRHAVLVALVDYAAHKAHAGEVWYDYKTRRYIEGDAE